MDENLKERLISYSVLSYLQPEVRVEALKTIAWAEAVEDLAEAIRHLGARPGRNIGA